MYVCDCITCTQYLFRDHISSTNSLTYLLCPCFKGEVNVFIFFLCYFQLIQSISAVDRDDSAEGHHFYFSLAQEASNNSHFTVKDNQGGVIHVAP